METFRNKIVSEQYAGGKKPMLTKEQEPTEPWGEPIKPLAVGPISKHLFEVIWIGTLLFMCVSEALVIHGLWFNPKQHFSTEKLFEIPIYVFFPILIGFSMRYGIGKMSKIGQISLFAAANLKIVLGMLLMITYMAILDLAGISFG
ncbi:MAG: hypothetical protein ABR991_05975 [Terracidiphilus sp.]